MKNLNQVIRIIKIRIIKKVKKSFMWALFIDLKKLIFFGIVVKTEKLKVRFQNKDKFGHEIFFEFGIVQHVFFDVGIDMFLR